jgi:hypothetical protein
VLQAPQVQLLLQVPTDLDLSSEKKHKATSKLYRHYPPLYDHPLEVSR